ncbi:MAG: DUF2480 family protein [Bacteroidia bacterium]
MDDALVNRVANSGIKTINLEKIIPEGEMMSWDIKQALFMEMVLKEKDFRALVKDFNWQQFQNANVAIFSSVDAIIPTWAFMLISSKLTGIARSVYFGTPEAMANELWARQVEKEDWKQYEGERVVIKGCGDVHVSPSAYMKITEKLMPIAQSIMYGEPCSTVPVYKKPKG